MIKSVPLGEGWLECEFCKALITSLIENPDTNLYEYQDCTHLRYLDGLIERIILKPCQE